MELSSNEILQKYKIPRDLRIEISENLYRKQFTESEKQSLAEILKPYMKEKTKPGKRTDLETKDSTLPNERVNESIGKILGESKETVRRRDKVFQDITDDDIRQLDEGKKSITSAYHDVVERENRALPSPPIPRGRYNHIVEDPGWMFSNSSIGGNGKSGASHKYKTLPTEEIARIPIYKSAAEDAVLYLWTTNQHLITGSMNLSSYYEILHVNFGLNINPKELRETLGNAKVQSDALSVMHCHGFVPKYIITWEKEGKEGWGGYGFSNVTEHLLIGTRGKVKPFGLKEKTIVKSKYVPRSHSQKPEEMWDLIEKCVKATGWKAKKIEFNCRTPRKGWKAHGDQLG